MCHYFFLSLHLLHLFFLPLAFILCPGFAQLVPVAHHSALPVSYCYSALPCPVHVSQCLPLAPCLHSGCSRCLFSLSFSFCLILLSVYVSMLLFCTPSVGWLRWLFSFYVCASRSFIIIQLYIRSLLTVHRLRRVSRFVVCYITVPSVLCLCHPPVTSIIVRLPHHLCLCGSAFIYCLRRRCVCRAIWF